MAHVLQLYGEGYMLVAVFVWVAQMFAFLGLWFMQRWALVLYVFSLCLSLAGFNYWLDVPFRLWDYAFPCYVGLVLILNRHRFGFGHTRASACHGPSH